MNWIVANMKWVMLICGLLTFTMVYAAISPDASLRSTFGETLNGPVADIIVRNWGTLIAMGGLMLIYGAFNPSYRPVILIYTGLGKLIFIGLVLAHGSKYLSYQAGLAVAIDSVMIVFFIAYLFGLRRDLSLR